MKLHLTHHPKARSSSDGDSGLHKIGRDPYADWALILTVTIIGALALIVLGFLTFRAASARVSEDSLSAGAAPLTFDEKGLNALLSIFDKRAAERAKLLKAYDGPGDPSL